MLYEHLSEKRKADRAKMAAILIEAMEEAGATCKLTDYANHIYPDGSKSSWTRRLGIDIEAPGGATIFVDFDGESCQPDVFVQTWQGPRDGKRWLHPRLGNVNPHHYSKLNLVCHGLDDLIVSLTQDIVRFADGSGYMTADDERIVRMRDRHREAGWDWYGEAA